MTEKQFLRNGVPVYYLEDSKFHEVLCNFKVYFELKPKQNTIANLLMRMMDDRLVNAPSKKEMSAKTDNLYGVKTSSQTYTFGKYQVIDLSVRGIHERFVDEPLTQNQLDLLADMFYEPLLTEETLEEAKRNLKFQIARIRESKAHFALSQAFKNAAPGQSFSLNSMGELEVIDTIQLSDIQSFHQACIDGMSKMLCVVGKVDDLDFSRFEEGSSEQDRDVLSLTTVETRRMDVMHPGTQTELVLVYDTPVNPMHPDYPSYLIYITLLGQLPSSLLFQNIREKESLAYSIYASRQIFDGIMYIATTINDKNLDKTLSLIEDQFALMQTEELDIDAAVRYLKLSLEGISESSKRQADNVFRDDLLEGAHNIEALMKALDTVTLESVRAIGDTFSKPFIYAYRGENNEEN